MSQDENMGPATDVAPPPDEEQTTEAMPPGGPPSPPSMTASGTEGPTPPEKKTNTWMWVAIGLGVLLLIVAAYYFITANKKIAVPSVVGATQTAAAQRLNSVGLKLGKVTTVESSTVPAGQVVSQNPVAGTEVAKNSAVDIVVSSGVATVAVPDVVGTTSADAQAELTELGLAVVISEEYSDTVASGDVIAQVPIPGSLANPGDTVALQVSRGKAPAKATVPDVVGRTQADAEAALGSAGFGVAVTTAFSDTVAKGVVGAQLPVGGTKVTPGSDVEIFVSLGKGVAAATVPNVVGMTEAQAVDAIQSAGLKPTVKAEFNDTAPEGTVFAQSPPGGTKTGTGTQVVIGVSLGKAPNNDLVKVPDVVGRTSAEASTTILDAGLNPQAVPAFSQEPAGTVFGQSPVAGAQVPIESTVVFLVSKGPNPAVVTPQ